MGKCLTDSQVLHKLADMTIVWRKEPWCLDFGALVTAVKKEK